MTNSIDFSIYIIPVLNFLICMAGVWICIIERFNKMDLITTKQPIRMQYLVKVFVFLVSGCSFGFEFPANAIQLFMGSLLLVDVMLGNSAWRLKQPGYAKKTILADIK